MKKLLIVLFSASSISSSAQISEKKQPSADELSFIQATFQEISRTDQIYREQLSWGTLDEGVLAKIDSVLENVGVQEGLIYVDELNLELSETVQDSLWHLQHTIDFRNHQYLRGIFERYGWIGEDVVEEENYVQLLLLMHPPKGWDPRQYLEEYSEILHNEVLAGRMPAKTYAMFYDNIKGKILRETQLYGTNQQFDKETKKVLPPEIEDLDTSNEARQEIGLSPLKEGEYRIATK
ncbi:MAG: hypothetical protein AB8B56_18760 [Crocinitomicaceae bacterium]